MKGLKYLTLLSFMIGALTVYLTFSSQTTSTRKIASLEKFSCITHLEMFFNLEREVFQGKLEIHSNNFHKEIEDLIQNIKLELKSSDKKDIKKLIEIYQNILKDQFFIHIFQNAIQHSSKEYNRAIPDFENAITTISIKIFKNSKGIQFNFSNPKLKQFPKSLNRRFYLHGKINLPIEERVGFVGRGRAHTLMIENLKYLPKDSYIEWSSKKKNILFSLFISNPIE